MERRASSPVQDGLRSSTKRGKPRLDVIRNQRNDAVTQGIAANSIPANRLHISSVRFVCLFCLLALLLVILLRSLALLLIGVLQHLLLILCRPPRLPRVFLRTHALRL